MMVMLHCTVGGNKSEAFIHYLALTIQAYLAIREIQDAICTLIGSYADADLPCFRYREDVLDKLKERFQPQQSDVQAAKYMGSLVMKAVHDWTGAAYDGVQKLQNNIYSPEWK
jgi:phosphatidylinositol 4-kinase